MRLCRRIVAPSAFIRHRFRSSDGCEATAGLSTRFTCAFANQNALIKVLPFQQILCIHHVDF
jgi:hypothetical protein